MKKPLPNPKQLEAQGADYQTNWQMVYRKLELHKIPNITSYQVDDHLFIVVPLGKK